ncbi:MAG: VWA domain-containing protein [Elusimicrobiota bacterium]|jgi:hypothetical protein
MLSFLSPGALWALPLAGLPVLLHLLFIRRAPRRSFSDLTLLREAHARALSAGRLRQWLLLLLRCLALLALVAAAARPVLHPRGASAAGAEEGLDVLILLDSSWSMRAEEAGRPRFERAVSVGLSFLRLLRPADRVAVASFSQGLDGELAFSPDARFAGEALARLRPGWKSTALAPALESAYAFLGRGEAHRRRAVLLLSDDSRHLLASLPSSGLRGIPGYDSRTLLLGLRWSQELSNAGIKEAAPASAGRSSVLVRSESFGKAPVSTSLDLWLRGRRVEQRALSLSEGASLSEIQLPSSNETELFGRLELRPDALPADDSWHFVLKVQPSPRVLYLHGGPDSLAAGRGGYFLRKLLSEEGRGFDAASGAEPGRMAYRLDAADMGRLSRLRLEDYSVVVLDDFQSVPPEVAEPLKRHVLRGGGLWIWAGDRLEEGGLESLADLLPGRLTGAYAPASGGLRADQAPASGPRGAFHWEDFDLANIAFGRRWGLEPSAEARVWLRDGGGAPLLAQKDFGRGRVLLWAASFDLARTNIALKPVFSALADTALSHLSAFTGERLWRCVRVGEPFERVWDGAQTAPARVEVESPDGRRTALVVRDRRVLYTQTREPGIYRMNLLGGSVQDESIEERFAVNADRSGDEGDLRPASVPWPQLRPEALREDFLLAVYGREARTLVLGLALLFLALEAVLIYPWRRT